LSGTALYDDEASISLLDDTILYQKYNILEKTKEHPCIRCGKCISVCPVFIIPSLLDEAYINGEYVRLDQNNVHSCIECGCCSYVCPSKRFLAQRIVAAKYFDKKRRNGR
jgi:electron transport complex protein RnfC